MPGFDSVDGFLIEKIVECWKRNPFFGDLKVEDLKIEEDEKSDIKL